MTIVTVLRFFTGPRKERRPHSKDSRFKFISEQLISSLPDNANPLVTETTEKLLKQHRTIEDTEARRRLEGWACKVIKWYLITVLFLILLNGAVRIVWQTVFNEVGFISDTVMYVLLSTTTVNIIGLGLIVLRGHFPQKDKLEKEDNS